MSVMALSGRYAKALFELAEKNKSLDIIEGDLLKLMRTIDNSPELRAALANPVIAKNNIENVLLDVLKKLGSNKLTMNFLSVLVQNGRIQYVAEIVSAYLDLMMQSRGEENAYVTTARELSKEQVVDIEQTIAKVRGNRIKAIMSVDDEILGGVIVRIGSMMLDASISGQLDKLAVLNKKAIANLN